MAAPENLVVFSKIGALAKEQCRPFDHQSDGFILGEGAANVILKRYEDAVADGDRIYAVIKGAAWGSDGIGKNAASPQTAGQVRVMRAGLRDANFEPDSIGYVECHGTATAAGDPVELSSLEEVFCASGQDSRPLIGSIKANVGHSLSASGVAGLIRAISSLYHKTIPPHAGWEKWHPNLEEVSQKFTIPQEPKAWDSELRRAGVSSFAFGGTNCFVCLEESQAEKTEPAADTELLFSFSAPSIALLGDYLNELKPHLEKPLVSVARTLGSRKLEKQVALIKASSKESLMQSVDTLVTHLIEPKAPPLDTPQIYLGLKTPKEDSELSDGWADLLTDFPNPDSELFGGKGPTTELPFVPLVRDDYWVLKSVTMPAQKVT